MAKKAKKKAAAWSTSQVTSRVATNDSGEGDISKIWLQEQEQEDPEDSYETLDAGTMYGRGGCGQKFVIHPDAKSAEGKEFLKQMAAAILKLVED